MFQSKVETLNMIDEGEIDLSWDGIDKSWDKNKELALVISSVKSSLWNENQADFGNKCLIRQLLQKCSGGNIVGMLNNILTGEEKTELVKTELDSFFQTQAQCFENYMKIQSENVPANFDSFFQTQAQSFQTHMRIKSENIPANFKIKTKTKDKIKNDDLIHVYRVHPIDFEEVEVKFNESTGKILEGRSPLKKHCQVVR